MKADYKDREVLSKIQEAPRFACSLGGALQSVHAIYRAVPIIHSAMGCNWCIYWGYSQSSGYQGGGYAGSTNAPCSRLGPKEVIFGGEDKLRELIRSSINIMDSDLFVVLTGCAGSLIGDDIGAIAKEFREERVPIVYADTGGYKGNTYRGYEILLDACADQLMEKPASKEKGLVNIIGVIPGQDVFWKGNLKEIQRLLEKVGLKVNVLFGHPSQRMGLFGLNALEKLPSAQLNIVLSPWVGVALAEKLEKRFGTPYLVFPEVPLGPRETGSLLRQVAEKTGIAQPLIDEVIAEETDEFCYYVGNLAELYIDFGMQFDFVVIGDSQYVIGVTKFLTNDMGCIPLTAVVTDDPPDRFRSTIRSELTNLDFGLKPDVIFESSSGEIQEALKQSEANLVLGSFMDRPLARSLGAACHQIGFPITDRVITNEPYAGYRGGLKLATDIYTAVLQTSY